jgi:hypothetical protein
VRDAARGCGMIAVTHEFARLRPLGAVSAGKGIS